jgi:hypothetical protein
MQVFIRLVKAVAVFDKERSWLAPLPQAQLPTPEQIELIIKGKKAGPAKSAAASPS